MYFIMYSTLFVHLAGDDWVAYSAPLECPLSVNAQVESNHITHSMLRKQSSPSFTISCSVCTKHPKLVTPRWSITFITLLVLSRKKTWTLLLIFHPFSIPSIAVAIDSPVCDPWNCLACSTAFCNINLESIHCAVGQ